MVVWWVGDMDRVGGFVSIFQVEGEIIVRKVVVGQKII